MRTKILLAGAIAVALAGLAYAGPSKGNVFTRWISEEPEAMVTDMFDQNDVDKSGSISRDEALAYFERLSAEIK
ncbi:MULTISPECIES: hypothetical protein [unclassified Devosia]|uniref:hypothetical protein n=1 Tax=unclassified Devosia TaxID=196773 RepID=UPI00145D4491|nr:MULTISPECIES: hypothetical protein [unclassified Devosia]MBJ6986890.1 hypothetical protein [Devosia sp. MC521]QMW63917.1 hypothetical protein H4N61_06260 [Devosia sp. MC521]